MDVRTTLSAAPTRTGVAIPDADVDMLLAEIEKGQQTAGHFPSPEAMNRARRMITGQITAAAAFAEIDAKFGR